MGVNESKGNVVAESILSLKLRYKMRVLYRKQRQMTNTCIYWVYGWAEAARCVTSNSHGTRIVHRLWVHGRDVRRAGCGCPQYGRTRLGQVLGAVTGTMCRDRCDGVTTGMVPDGTGAGDMGHR